jgi:hypothetical protein
VSDWYRDHAHYERRIADCARDWSSFISTIGADFPADLRALYERTLEGLPRLWEPHLARRVATRVNLTLSNGDCYFAQFLCPNDPGDSAEPTYIIQFQGICTDLPAMDRVFLFATFWTPEQRREGNREQRLLCHHLDTLHAHGITDYTWDDLLANYRFAVLFMILYPIWDQANGSSRDYWWPRLSCLTGAFRDLGCADLPG